MTTKSKTATGDALVATYTPAIGEACFLELKPRYAALTAADLLPISADIEAGSLAAIALCQRVTAGDLGKTFALLPRECFDPTFIEVLPKAAWAARHAAQEWDKFRAGLTDAKLPSPLVTEATEVEARMQRCCEYLFSDDAEIRPLLDLLRPGTGYRDLASDLDGYASIYRRRADIVCRDIKHYRPTDYDAALRCSKDMVEILARSLTPEAQIALENVTRAWSLLHQTYFEVRETGRWLERHHPDRDALYPSIWSAARPGVGQRRKKVGEPTPPVEPTQPA